MIPVSPKNLEMLCESWPQLLILEFEKLGDFVFARNQIRGSGLSVNVGLDSIECKMV